MKKSILGIIVLLGVTSLFAPPSVDGTNAVVYLPTAYAFSGGETPIGFVWFTDGFSIAADTSITLSVPIPVAGTIQGNDTGTLILGSDMYLAPRANLSGGMKIDGQGKTIFLGDNLTLPANKTFEILSSLTIDGKGNALNMQTANFYVNGSSETTLRLKNMHLSGIKDLADSLASIRFGSSAVHKLILENVTLRLAGDYTFDGAMLNIAGQVLVVGDHAINYVSNQDCVIRHGAILTLGLHATFNYQPEDRLATHFVFKGPTSALYLAGGTLFAPKNTGIHLTKGHLIVDHKSYLKQDWLPEEHFGFGRGRIAIGNGLEKNKNMAIDIFPAAQLIEQAVALNYGNVDEN